MTQLSDLMGPIKIAGITPPAQKINPTAPYKNNAFPPGSSGQNPGSGAQQNNSLKNISSPNGLSNVANVFGNLITLKPIYANTGNPTTDVIVGAAAQSAGTAALGLGILGLGAAGVDYVAGGAVAPALTSTTGKALPNWLVPAGIGALGGYLLGGKGSTQTTTPTQNTNPTVTPTQTTNPQITTPNNTNPTVYVPGSGNVIYQDTYSYSQSTPTQNTLSYQTTNTTTNANQTTTTTQSTGIDPIWIALAAAAVLIFNN